VFLIFVVIVSPMIVLSWLEKKLQLGEALFVTFAHLLALIPGPVGYYVRAAFYFGTLDSCSWETHIGFGSLFSHRGARVAANVSTGTYCVLGHVEIESGVRLASRISIPSGKRQHLDGNGALASTTQYDLVCVGANTWIGEGAIILANVGCGTIVSAGAVVIKEVPGNCIVGGNPAKVLKTYGSIDSTQED
jgi:acetyltransferase-like isoleucine patch superfamily enzyme